MTDLIKRLQEHNDERLYKEADLLMREAANAILAAQAEVNVKHEALAYSVELFKMVVRHLPGQQITWIKSGDEPDINAALAFQPDLSALSAHDAAIRKEAAREALEKAAAKESAYQCECGAPCDCFSAYQVFTMLRRMIAELDQPKGDANG